MLTIFELVCSYTSIQVTRNPISKRFQSRIEFRGDTSCVVITPTDAGNFIFYVRTGFSQETKEGQNE